MHQILGTKFSSLLMFFVLRLKVLLKSPHLWCRSCLHRPLGLARAETIYIHNPSQEVPVTLLSMFTSSRHFYVPFFHRRVSLCVCVCVCVCARARAPPQAACYIIEIEHIEIFEVRCTRCVLIGGWCVVSVSLAVGTRSLYSSITGKCHI